MHRSGSDGAMRHLDFTLFDMLIMQLSFMITHSIMGHESFLYFNHPCRVQAIIFFSAQMALGMHSETYNHIFTRDLFDEFLMLLINVLEIWLLGGVFIILAGIDASVEELVLTSFVYFDLAYFVRHWNKKRHLRKGLPVRKMVIITTRPLVWEVILRIRGSHSDMDYQLEGILLQDHADLSDLVDTGVPVFYADEKDILDKISHWWIDDVFLLLDNNIPFPEKLIENLLLMGISVHTTISMLDKFAFAKSDLQEIGSYKAITKSIKFISDRSNLLKRLMDIIGGLAGTIVTGILFLFVAPAIYIKSPGPIFFKQRRVGMNGKYFYMYKFRSMYMDAEKRKAELMAQNKIQGGLMFKMDDDPRIIGSEKKGKNGKPKGIGNFIRNTSIDEFPQFVNVLKGDMSLVGTRPPTVDEWNHYDPLHRVRMSAKPGITGLWQVSGRSKITDFDQVVALDKQYIENWSLWLDLKILLKTVMVVLRHDGAS